MDELDPRIRFLLRQADKVAAEGKRGAAEKLYRQVLEEAPGTVPAWLGLAGVLGDPAAREAAFRQVLALEPGNEAALNGLMAPAAPPLPFGPDGAGERGRPGPAALPAYPVTPASQPPAPPAAVAKAAPAVPSGQAQEALFCYVHPNRQTTLRCNKCGRPICMNCAKRTPVGYRCKECIKEQQAAFYTATAVDYVVAIFTSLVLGGLASFLLPQFGFLVFFVAAFVGTLIGRVVLRLVGRRHGRWLPHLVAVMLILTGMAPTVLPIAAALAGGGIEAITLASFGSVWRIIYIIVASGSAYYQVK